MKKNNVQYGCGLSAPVNWQNFDASPSLRLQRIPLIGMLFYRFSSTKFPKNVRYGDIIKGLPLKDESCDSVYCSHVLEHLAKDDFHVALRNTYKILRRGGQFRLLIPDLEAVTLQYIDNLKNGNKTSNSIFINETHLGMLSRPKSLLSKIKFSFGNSNHLWMWDFISLAEALKEVGFKEIQRCIYNDSSNPAFKEVENEGRFKNAVAIECTK